jgi:hypothetical protein
VVICATAAELPDDEDEAGAEDAGADDAGADDAGADELDDEDDELELLQAATVSASARASAGAMMIRRATRGNRICASLVSVGCATEGLPHAGDRRFSVLTESLPWMVPYLLISTPGCPTPASGTIHQK